MFGFLAFLGAFIFLFVIAGIILYILMAYGLYRMACNQNIEYAWMSFIPVVQFYTLGKLIKNLKVLNFEIPSVELTLPISLLVVIILGRIPVLGTLLWLAMAVLMYAAVYKLYTVFKTRQEAETMLIISIVSIILMGFMVPVYIFMLRDAKPLNS